MASIRHQCTVPLCPRLVTSRRRKCTWHISGTCETSGCEKVKIHGYNNCTKHGGGRKCITPDCTTSAIGGYDNCSKHGGGLRCKYPECNRHIRNGPCKLHGNYIIPTEPTAQPIEPTAQPASDVLTILAQELPPYDFVGTITPNPYDRKQCTEPGCLKRTTSRHQQCSNHRTRTCETTGCSSLKKPGYDYCTKHGAGDRCATPGCKSAAIGGRACIKHGGGPRCKYP